LKLGLSILWRGATIDATRKISLEAENLGFEYLWITEAWGLEALSTIGYLLGLTQRIKIGTGILNVYSRSAALIGMACATLEQISPGRFVLGLGSSGKSLVQDWHGMKFEYPLQRTKEYVEVIKRVARGESVDYSGEVLKLSRFKLYSNPLDTDLKIYLGAIGERNLRLSGSIANGAIVTMYPISKLQYAVDLICGTDGSGTKKNLVFAYFPAAVTRSDAETKAARRAIARNISFYVSSMGPYYAKNLSKLGFDQSVKKILDAYASGGSKRAAEAVDEKFMDELSLVGTEEEVRAKISRMPSGVVPVVAIDQSSAENISMLRAFEPLIKS
jgi:alkanesulfonate monooxygenase SsuD/methylene tetrahydromethanopterin reductase-like flavin-dependent oxidoreductase (luciferase family)